MNVPVKGWTQSRYWQYIRSALRAAYRRYPPRYQALNAAREEKRRGKQKWEYKCACCKNSFPNKVVVVDHLEPCGVLSSYADLPAFVEKLFCSVDQLQVLCKPCHYIKTMEERGVNPEMASFNKLNAEEQKETLKKLKLSTGKNVIERRKIYADYLEK